jgi:uncharacterized protein YutE (UPF0331/DUF86 family)
MVSADKARRLLAELLGCISDLERYRARFSRSDLSTQRDVQHMVLRALYVAAQSALDLALHLVSDGALPQAITYQDSFRRLAEGGVIDTALADRLAGWAGFRNVLAHLYASIDLDRVHASLSEVDDLKRFAAIVAAKLDT